MHKYYKTMTFMAATALITETTTMYLVVGIPVFQTGCHPLIA